MILMDEPFAALDAQTKLEMQEELVTLWQRYESTIVFVTHSVDEALILATKVAVMTHRPGRIRELIDVAQPRPRDSTSQAFNDAKRHVPPQQLAVRYLSIKIKKKDIFHDLFPRSR